MPIPTYTPVHTHGSLGAYKVAQGVTATVEAPVVLTVAQCFALLLDKYFEELEALLVSRDKFSSPNCRVSYDRDRALHILLQYAADDPLMTALRGHTVGSLSTAFGRALAQQNLPNKRGLTPQEAAAYAAAQQQAAE